jgi:hypothetical protein
MNETMGFEGKWIQLEDIMLSEVSKVQKIHALSHMRKTGPKGKHIYKNKHNHILTYM